MFKTKNDQFEETRAKAIELLNARLRTCVLAVLSSPQDATQMVISEPEKKEE